MRRALATNREAVEFQQIDSQSTPPVRGLATGAFDAGIGGQRTAQAIRVIPYAYADIGSEWWMRIYGWQHIIDGETTDNQSADLWVPTILAERYYVASHLTGVLNRIVGPAERFVDAGNSTIFSEVFALRGCRVFQFDFAVGDMPPAFPNALWAKA